MKKANSTNSINDTALQNFCNAHKTLSQINGRWKVSIILVLKNNQLLYTEVKSAIPKVTDRMLSKQLKELQEDNIITNEKNKTQSIYFLTTKGQKMVKLLEYINRLRLK